MKAKVRVVLEHAVSVGVAFGLRRFYKHRDDSPSQQDLAELADVVAEVVMEEICEWFDTSGESDV